MYRRSYLSRENRRWTSRYSTIFMCSLSTGEFTSRVRVKQSSLCVSRLGRIRRNRYTTPHDNPSWICLSLNWLINWWVDLCYIGADLREIQRQIDHLEGKTSPEQVSQLVTLRRDVLFLQFDTAVRHSMRETFLARGNKQAHQVSTAGECVFWWKVLGIYSSLSVSALSLYILYNAVFIANSRL